ncbi:low temperature requirement protein A [Solwaraspora sp. WMMA2065]|uniref:low temperature requirement protein A n=1 Tax=Solwaraspora sp. WMMA2065 TaxID=3015166 RepID=UPI00259BAE77|nr:low temperature requirement protein A [Solwaraspora sp. WMMA2065]WJK33666.1 low temperature requirement protein A [Solwaraspora sp. WMMA2065]
MSDAGRSRVQPAAPGAKVTRLELFFDLVFVFAFIHLNTLAVEDLDALILLGVILLLAALWLAWSRFAVLGNNLRADQGIMPIIGFAIMAAVFVSVATLPGTEDDVAVPSSSAPLSIPGQLVFPACYFIIWALEMVALRHAARNHPSLREMWWRSAPALLLSCGLLVVAALLPRQFTGNARIAAFVALWGLAVAIAYAVVIRTKALAVVSAGHWAERHAQIVLIALGESVISIGIGAELLAGTPLTLPLVAGVVLGIALICALWWWYFDSRSIAAEHVLHRTQGTARLRLARDAYTLLHFPMVLGIILLSLGAKQVLAYLASDTGDQERAVLDPVHLWVLYGGVVLYLLALLAFQARTVRSVDPLGALPVLVITALLPMAPFMPPLAALALLSLIAVAAAAVDNLRGGSHRRSLRGSQLAQQQALESEETNWRRRHL